MTTASGVQYTSRKLIEYRSKDQIIVIVMPQVLMKKNAINQRDKFQQKNDAILKQGFCSKT